MFTRLTIDTNEIYTRGMLHGSADFAQVKNTGGDKIKSIHATFYGGYALTRNILPLILTQ